MRRIRFPFLAMAAGMLALVAGQPALVGAREKEQPIPTNDPTYKLFSLLDGSFAGKLTDFYLLADVYKDGDHQGEELQHVLRVEYDKNLFFGKFKIYVRSISKPTDEQLKAYTTKQLYDFGSDSEKFEKIGPGPLGQKGDLYLRAVNDMPFASTPITPEVQATYQKILTQYVIPAVEKSKRSG